MTEPNATPTPSTALAAPVPPATAVTPLDPNEGTGTNAFASASKFGLAQRMAQALSQSTMVPKAYQGNIPNCLIALEIADRTGASPFMVMQNLDVVYGRPSWRATFLIATVNDSKEFTKLRYRWEGTPGKDDWGCRAVAKDRETGEECKGALVTIAMAKAEGWYDRKSKEGAPASKWPTMPEQMLMYRAASFWTRVYAPERSLGMQTSDEVLDSQDIAGDAAAQLVETVAQLPEGRRMSLKKGKKLEDQIIETVQEIDAKKDEAIKNPLPLDGGVQVMGPTGGPIAGAGAPPPAKPAMTAAQAWQASNPRPGATIEADMRLGSPSTAAIASIEDAAERAAALPIVTKEALDHHVSRSSPVAAVHLMRAGQEACGTIGLPPDKWDSTHCWAYPSEAKLVTCSWCRDVLKDEAVSAKQRPGT